MLIAYATDISPEKGTHIVYSRSTSTRPYDIAKHQPVLPLLDIIVRQILASDLVLVTRGRYHTRTDLTFACRRNVWYRLILIRQLSRSTIIPSKVEPGERAMRVWHLRGKSPCVVKVSDDGEQQLPDVKTVRTYRCSPPCERRCRLPARRREQSSSTQASPRSTAMSTSRVMTVRSHVCAPAATTGRRARRLRPRSAFSSSQRMQACTASGCVAAQGLGGHAVSRALQGGTGADSPGTTTSQALIR